MTSDPRSDSALLAAHVAGDPHAFGELFARHRTRLWAVALRTMGNPADAEDGLQDALIAAFRRASTYDGRAAVTTWLHRVVVNACLDRLRAAKVRAATPTGDDLEDFLSHGTATVTVISQDPSDVALDHERRDRVVAALADLPPEQRAALVLVDMEGHSVAEVAEMLECAVGTVKSRCARGRRRLAEVLFDLKPLPPGAPGNQPSVPDVPSVSEPRGPPA